MHKVEVRDSAGNVLLVGEFLKLSDLETWSAAVRRAITAPETDGLKTEIAGLRRVAGQYFQMAGHALAETARLRVALAAAQEREKRLWVDVIALAKAGERLLGLIDQPERDASMLDEGIQAETIFTDPDHEFGQG